MGKGEIARDEQFLLFPQCFLTITITFSHVNQILNCRLLTLTLWKSLKFVVRERNKRICRRQMKYCSNDWISSRTTKKKVVWKNWFADVFSIFASSNFFYLIFCRVVMIQFGVYMQELKVIPAVRKISVKSNDTQNHKTRSFQLRKDCKWCSKVFIVVCTENKVVKIIGVKKKNTSFSFLCWRQWVTRVFPGPPFITLYLTTTSRKWTRSFLEHYQ